MARDTTNLLGRMTRVLSAVILVVVCLYFGREVLLPLSLAILFSFLLLPLVNALEQRKFPRILAVLLSVLLVLGGVGVGGWLIGVQLTDLASNLKTYKENLKGKLENLQISHGSVFGNVKETVDEVTEDMTKEKGRVQRVRVVPDSPVPWESLQSIVSGVMTPLANAGIIVILVIFMLISREDLRNRMVRLAGKRLTLTTRTLDEISNRISRYLIMLLAVNGGFSLVISLGLWQIGVEYALMWGLLAGLLRFIPYIGPVIGGSLPLAMALIQFPSNDWMHPLAVIVLFSIVEIITSSAIEPYTYGKSAGVSTMALLVSATFWTWVWGPVGLVLSVPLTVVLAVLGEHVTALEPLAILLGDKPPLDNDVIFYQRILARDVEESAGLIDEQHKTRPLIDIYDRVVIPALLQAERDFIDDELSAADQQFIWDNAAEIVDEHKLPPAPAGADRIEPLDRPQRGLKAFIVGCPAHDQADELALTMLMQTLLPNNGEIHVLPATMLASEVVERVRQRAPDAICVSALGSVSTGQTRYLCKRLRQAFPNLRIIVGRWGYRGDKDKLAANLRARGADDVVTTLNDARDQLDRILPLDKPVREAASTKASLLALASSAARKDGLSIR